MTRARAPESGGFVKVGCRDVIPLLGGGLDRELGADGAARLEGPCRGGPACRAARGQGLRAPVRAHLDHLAARRNRSMTPLILIAAGIVGVGAATDASADAALVRVTIRAVAATQKDAPNDPRLSAIAGSLDDFGKDFRYRGYRLVSAESFALGWRVSGEMELPGRRSVSISLLNLHVDGRGWMA